MEKLILILLPLCINLGLMAQSLTIEDAVDYALENSYEVRQARLDVADADARISETLSTGLPKIDGTVRYQYYPDVPNFLIPAQFADPDAPAGSFIALAAGTKQSLSAGLDLNALLFDGSFFVGLQAARVFKDLTQKEGNETRQEVIWNVRRAFYSALLVKEQISELDRNLENLEKLLTETRALYREGFSELLDVRRLELNFNTLQSRRDQMAKTDSLTQNILKFQMAWPMDKPIEITGNLEEMAKQWMVQQVQLDYQYSDRPDYSVMEVTQELTELNVKQIRMGYLPKLYAFASHNQNLRRDNLFNNSEIGWLKTTSVGATLSVPIFDGLEKKYQSQRAKISMEKVTEGKNQLREVIDMEVQNNHIRFNNAVKSWEDSKALLDLSEEIYDTVLIKYREGMGSSYELIQAEQDLFEARTQHLNTLYEILETRAQLEKSLGS
nr:TolC family protein [Saprospiraceae bacterium]